MHGESAVAASSEWSFAEGATHSGFALYYLLFNPTATQIEVALSLFTPDGPMRSAGGVPVEWSVMLPGARYPSWPNGRPTSVPAG